MFSLYTFSMQSHLHNWIESLSKCSRLARSYLRPRPLVRAAGLDTCLPPCLLPRCMADAAAFCAPSAGGTNAPRPRARHPHPHAFPPPVSLPSPVSRTFLPLCISTTSSRFQAAWLPNSRVHWALPSNPPSTPRPGPAAPSEQWTCDPGRTNPSTRSPQWFPCAPRWTGASFTSPAAGPHALHHSQDLARRSGADPGHVAVQGQRASCSRFPLRPRPSAPRSPHALSDTGLLAAETLACPLAPCGCADADLRLGWLFHPSLV